MLIFYKVWIIKLNWIELTMCRGEWCRFNIWHLRCLRSGVCINAALRPDLTLFDQDSLIISFVLRLIEQRSFHLCVGSSCHYYENVPVKIVWLYITVVCSFRDLFWSRLGCLLNCHHIFFQTGLLSLNCRVGVTTALIATSCWLW